MINPFLLSNKERVAAWKHVRNNISQCTHLEQCVDLALAFWQQAPVENNCIDWDNAHCWPGPWEMLKTNSYCTHSHSLGVAYTLMLANPDLFDHLTVDLIHDRENHVQKLVVNCKDWYLNHGHVDKKLKSRLQQVYTLATWQWNQKNWTAT
jgi:hypothetical protein